MNILAALKQEQARLQQQLKGISGAIAALNGSHPAASRAQWVGPKAVKRTDVCSS